MFYDYDELCLLESCRFRAVPPVRDEDEMRPLDEWLYAARDDVFPEQFPQFLGLPAPLREALLREHGEIFDPAWWRQAAGAAACRRVPGRAALSGRARLRARRRALTGCVRRSRRRRGVRRRRSRIAAFDGRARDPAAQTPSPDAMRLP